jgi:hypothetical protein
MKKPAYEVRFPELVPAEWFRSKILVKFERHKVRTYRGTLSSCIDCTLRLLPKLRFKRYQLYKDGLELPGIFAVAGNVVLIEERNMPDNGGKICFYSCADSLGTRLPWGDR